MEVERGEDPVKSSSFTSALHCVNLMSKKRSLQRGTTPAEEEVPERIRPSLLILTTETGSQRILLCAQVPPDLARSVLQGPRAIPCAFRTLQVSSPAQSVSSPLLRRSFPNLPPFADVLRGADHCLDHSFHGNSACDGTDEGRGLSE